MDILEAIERTEMPPSIGNMVEQTRITQARNMRHLFRMLGIEQMNVTTVSPYSIRIELPRTTRKKVCCATTESRFQCPHCKRLLSVLRRLRRILVSAFPDLRSRRHRITVDHVNCWLIAS